MVRIQVHLGLTQLDRLGDGARAVKRKPNLRDYCRSINSRSAVRSLGFDDVLIRTVGLMPEIAESTSVGELRPCNAQMVTDLVEERDCLVEKLFCSRIRERSVEETGPHELDFGAELGPAVIRDAAPVGNGLEEGYGAWKLREILQRFPEHALDFQSMRIVRREERRSAFEQAQSRPIVETRVGASARSAQSQRCLM
ncbi:MAG TPA: hypothetical protein VM580_23405 [Labilithrix sp.]|nr:hypothetical protein [Labilithrix sp.]